MSKTIVAITTTFNGNTRFVTDTFGRPDNLVSVELSEERDEAHDFKSFDAAADICVRIFNPYERFYLVEELKKLAPVIPFNRTASDLEEKVLK